MSDKDKICVKCGLPVESTKDYYEVQEKMHWLCFHLEFEHDGDPDQPCSDPSCPWWRIRILEEKIVSLGGSPKDAMKEGLKKHWKT